MNEWSLFALRDKAQSVLSLRHLSNCQASITAVIINVSKINVRIPAFLHVTVKDRCLSMSTFTATIDYPY